MGASSTPPVSARTVTAAPGLHPDSSSGLMNAPERPKLAAATTAMVRPTDVDARFIGLLGKELAGLHLQRQSRGE